jgi:fibronectin-binding autotransporter adhesin
VPTLNVINRGLIETQSSGAVAINSAGPTTIRNAGTIANMAGTGFGAITLGGNTDTLILEPISVITGYVDAGGGTNTLALGGDSGSGSFNLSQIGNTSAFQYRNFNAFDKRESSVWTLTGSYTGTQNWTLNGGTLVLNNGATLAGNVINPSTSGNNVVLQVGGTLGNGSGTTAIDLEGSGSNSVVLNSGAAFGNRTFRVGAGTVTLTGPVAFPNAVTIAGGTLQVGDGGAGTGGAITGNIADNAALVFNRSDALTYAGLISGTGSLTQNGSGTLTLTAQGSSYTGGTTVNAGTLQIGATGVDYGSITTGVIRGTITVNPGATLIAAGRNSFGTSGTLSNNVNAVKLVGGTLNQAGDGDNGGWGVAYELTGATMQSTGTGQFSFGAPAGGSTSVTAHASATTSVLGGHVTLRENNAGNVVNFTVEQGTTPSGIDLLVNALVDENVGSHGIVKLGAGNMTMTGTDTYTGGTTISAGTLQIGNGGTTGSLTGNITDNAALVFNRSDSVTYAGVVSGTGTLAQSGTGTLVLSGTNTYAGGTFLNAGTLSVTSDGNLGATAGALTFNGGTLLTAAGISSARSANLLSNGTIDNGGKADTFSGVFSGAGALTSTGAGQLTLTGDNTYTGGTTISAGTVQLGNGGISGSIVGNVIDNAALIVNRTDSVTLPGAISGTGTLTQAGSGTTILTGNNTYTGATTIAAGTLQLGNGGTSGSVVGNIADNAAVIFNRSDALTFGGVVSGSGNLTQAGTGTLILTSTNTYTGATNVNAGTLRVNGSIASPTTTVLSGATLGGSGTLSGAVTIQNGGHLAPGNSPGTLTIGGNLMLSPTSQLDYELGQVNVPGGALNDLTSVGGNLTLDGTLNVSVSAGGSFGPGVYRLINYTGALTNNGLDFGTLPTGFTPNVDLLVQTAVPQQVNLINAQALGPLTFWDGNNSALFNNNVVNGGSGSWLASAADASWTDSTGAVNASWATNGLAIFQGTPGTVTVDNSAGAVTFSGAQFAANGYTVTGAPLTTTTADTMVRVGDGTGAGAAMAATIGAVIQGAGGLDKTDLGTLVLSGANTYTGGTTIAAGTLQLGSGGTSGSVVGNITDNAALVFNHSDAVIYGGIVSGTGTLTQLGTGTLTLTGNNTYTGSTTVSAGTLQLGNGGTSGGVAGLIVDNAALVINHSNSVTLPGVISGTGTMSQAGTGTTVLTGNNTYTGGTAIAAGTLQLGSGGTSGSVVGNIADNAALVINRSNSVTLPGVISGTGSFSQAGTGTTILTGNNTYTGGTAVHTGTLQLGSGGTTGSITGNITDTTSLVFNRSDAITYGGVISGTGSVTQNGTGVLTLTASNTYTGATIINQGVVAFSSPNNLGTLGNPIVFNGGTLRYLSGAFGFIGRPISVLAGGATVDSNAFSTEFRGVASGVGGVTKIGAGTIAVTGANTYTGGTTINGGAIQLGTGGTSGSIAGNVVDNASLIFDRSDTLTFAGVISGTGAVSQIGTGTTILTGNDTYTGATTISAGRLQIGAGGASGSIVGPVTDNAALVFNRSDALGYGGVISGTGTLAQSGAGILTLTGANTYTGATSVNAGTLRVNGSIASPLTTVFNGATLGGSGTVGGAVTIQSGGHLAPGNSPGTLTITGDLLLSSGSLLDYELGQANVAGGALNDLTSVGGNLTLDGTLNVAVSAGGSFGPGVYRLINYTGALTNNTLDFGTVPAGFTPNVNLFVQTAMPQQVNLINAQALGPLTFWDGNNAAAFNNGVVNGGAGTWQASPGDASWTDSTGAVNASWQPNGFAIFQGTPGTVTVDNSAGAVTFSGAQFAVNGYSIIGQPLTTSTADTIVRVGDGTSAGAGFIATISDVIQGSGGIDKTDLGTLVLAGANTYSGGTTVSSGTLSISSDTNLGNASGALTFNGGTLLTTAGLTSARTVNLAGSGTIDNGGNSDTFSSAIGGSGALTSAGSGTLILTADNTYTGGTTISAGTLQLGNGGTSGSVTGAITDNAALVVNRSDTVTLPGVISGSGTLTQAGTGTTILASDNTYTGGTTVSAGTLQLGNGGTSGSVVGAITDNAALVVNRSDTVTLPGVISGSGTLTQAGTGTTILASDNTYTGGTTVSAGTLQLGNGGTSGSVTGAITDNAALVVNRSDTVTLPGVISGSGTLTQAGTGTTILTSDNTYTGGTIINRGVLQIGNGGLTGSVTGSIVNNGLLVFFRADLGADSPPLISSPFIISTPISGSGFINFKGTGVSGQSGYQADAANGGFDGNVVVESGARLTLSGGSTGTGNGLVIQDGGGLWLTNNAMYSNPIAIAGQGWLEPSGRLGAIRIADGAMASGPVILTADARIDTPFAHDTGTFSGVISDDGNGFVLEKAGPGGVTFTGDNTYTGGTLLSEGTLNIGNGGTSGSVLGNITDNATLVFNRSDAPGFGGVISGSGTLEQRGLGTLTLTGANTYGGTTTVSAGTLLINGNQTAATGAVSVASSATLGGTGITGGNVTVADGGHLQGSQGQSFALNALTLNPASQVDVSVTGPGTIGVFNIDGNGGGAGAGSLVLDGNLNVSAAGSLGPGVYRVMSYTGAFTNNGLAFGTVPAGFTPDVDLFIQTSVARQVNLVNAQSVGPLNFWDGNNSGLFDNGHVDGGSGTWLAAPANDAWSEVAGSVNAPWQANGFAVFQATPGTVTVDNSAGAVTFSGAQFAVNGYTVTGAPLTTTTPDAIIRVGDGTAAGVAMTATISAVIQGSGGLDKTDLGTLVLSGVNTYTGGTTVGGGTLSIGSDTNLGAANTGLTLNGGTLLTSGAVSSPRPVTLGSLGGTIHNGGNADAFSGLFSGAGALTVAGTGTVRLDADNTYTGGTTIASGTLQLGNGGATGSVTGNIVNNGALVLNRSGTTAYAGIISGSGSLASQTGTVTLAAANTYTGATTVNAGMLLINGNQAAATGAVSVASGATLGGTGTTGGTVTVADNAHLLGAQGQVFTMNALVLNPLSQVDVTLSAPGTTGLFNINGTAGGPGAGNLTLDGSLNITAAGGFGPGVYRLMNYTGALTDNGLVFGTVPGGFVPNVDLAIQTAVPRQVNLLNVRGVNLTFWDGGDSTLHRNGQIDGGTGNWLAGSSDAWADGTGTVNGAWPADGFAIFAATPGTVTVDNSAGAVTFSGAQFAVDGYTITGQPLTTTTPDTIIRVGDGTAAGAAMTATIGAVIQGTGGLDKTDLGKLILTGNNTYTGGTTISSGVLQLGNGGTSGSVAGNVINNGALVFNRSDSVFQDGIISGTGSVTQAGSGKLVFNGVQPYSGGTQVIGGTLVVGDASHTDAALTGGGPVIVGAGGSLGGYGKVTGPVVNSGLIGVGNALPALANGPDAVFTIAGNLDNRGTVTMANGVAGDRMIVTGGTYVSNGGQVLIDTVLNEGGANAQSDRLVADATSVGSGGATRITVHPAGGQGALTQQDGIQVVAVGNRSVSASGAFVLDGRVVAGPYEYKLFEGGVSDPADGQWYLRSARPTPTPPGPPEPLFRPEVAAYLANQHLAGQMFVHSLHDRLGEPQFVAGQGSDPAQGQARSGWLRMTNNWEGSRSADGNFKVSTYDFQMQGGAELAKEQVMGKADRLHLGVMGSYGTASSHVDAAGNPAGAKGTVEGWLVGPYGTWYQNDETKLGAYVDTWFQYGWFSNRVEGDQLPTVRYNAQGWAISGETGYALPLRNDWVVEPQAQLIYVNYREGDITEPNGTRVSGADASGWITRLGARIYRTFMREDARKVQPYVTLNWWHTSTNSSISFNQVPVGSLYPSNRYEVKLGVNGELGKCWTAWTNVSGAWGAQDFHQYVLRVGVKYTW